MRRTWIGVIAGLLASTSAAAQGLPTTAKDVASVRESGPTRRSYPQASVDAWERDLRAGLAHGSAESAADTVAERYGLSQAEMRGLADAWIIARARRYATREDQSWKQRVRSDLLALLPSARHRPLGLVIAAETLDAMDDCSADDFDALLKGSADRAADAYVIANAAPCGGNFTRAVLAGRERAMPALIRSANWGSLTPRQVLPLYAWLTSPAALARIDAADRPALSAILWQRYIELLLRTGLNSRALALLDAMPAEMRARVLAPHDTPLGMVTVDGIAMSFRGEGGSETMGSVTADKLEEAADMLDGGKPGAPPPVLVSTRSSAPILAVANALAMANRTAEAGALLDTLPGLAAARATSLCLYRQEDRGWDKCPGSNDLPMDALVLDHLLYHDGDDPYAIAEVLVRSHAIGTPAAAEIDCRVFPADQFPGICAGRRKATRFDDQLDESMEPDEAVRGEAVLAQVIPGFAALRDGLVAEVMAAQVGAPDTRSWTHESVTPVTPGFAEHPLPAGYAGAAGAPPPKGLAKLPDGFELVRAERAGRRAIAISVSQTYDPTGEVSRGGYWVHLSEDGGAHWQRPLYTGLADRFPYVVAGQSRLPLLAGDTLNLAVDVAEIDTASITYPPVGLRTSRREKGLYLEIQLAALQRDSDGDGLTDIAAHHLLIDHARTDGGTPFVIGSDLGASCTAPQSPDRAARIAVLGKLFDPSGAAIVEPADRPAGEIGTGWKSAGAAPGQPLFLLGDPKDYACIRAGRPMIVYREADIAAIRRFTPDFHVMDVPPIIFDRARDRGYVTWSAGWTGGTYRLRLVKGQWVFDELSSWIS